MAQQSTLRQGYSNDDDFTAFPNKHQYAANRGPEVDDAIEFMGDKFTDKGPASGKITAVDGDKFTVQFADEAEVFDWNEVRPYADIRGRLWFVSNGEDSKMSRLEKLTARLTETAAPKNDDLKQKLAKVIGAKVKAKNVEVQSGKKNGLTIFKFKFNVAGLVGKSVQGDYFGDYISEQLNELFDSHICKVLDDNNLEPGAAFDYDFVSEGEKTLIAMEVYAEEREVDEDGFDYGPPGGAGPAAVRKYGDASSKARLRKKGGIRSSVEEDSGTSEEDWEEHERQKCSTEETAAGDEWWKSLTKKQQDTYIALHPNSKYAKHYTNSPEAKKRRGEQLKKGVISPRDVGAGRKKKESTDKPSAKTKKISASDKLKVRELVKELLDLQPDYNELVNKHNSNIRGFSDSKKDYTEKDKANLVRIKARMEAIRNQIHELDPSSSYGRPKGHKGPSF